MTGKNRHNKYRRSIYKRQRISTVIISVSATLAIVLITLLIVGNVLHNQSKKRHENKKSDDTIQEIDGTYTPFDKNANAYSVLLQTDDTTVFKDRIQALTSSQITDVSIPLNTKDGTLRYSSEVSKQLGFSSNATVKLEDACASAKDLGVYLSGSYYLNAFAIEDTLLRSVELSKASAIIAEALTVGVDDVVVISTELKYEHVDEIIRFVEDIRILSNGKGHIGITLTDNILEQANVSDIIRNLDKSIDFLAVDASLYGEEKPTEYVDAKINSKANFEIRRYNMRILLPFVEDSETQSEIVDIVDKNGIKNFQIIR